MNAKKIIIPIIVVAVACGVGYYCYHVVKTNTVSENTTTSSSSTSATTSNNLTVDNPLFSTGQSSLYYKLEQAVGDTGMPSDSITVNLNNSVTINGETYYKVYNYATRSAYTTPIIYEGTDNNFSQLVSEPVYVSENGNIVKDASSEVTTEFNDNLSKLSNEEKYNSLYQIVAEYVEGYTANNPNYKTEDNDNYEGDLNDAPTIKINMDNYKTINNMDCYEATVTLNSKEITIYVALDGYIYVQSKTDYEELFFPAYLNENVSVEESNV